ncbi:hypothetical protein [Desulfosarcina sp.]|uniref:hypothetical protein n=1 Tax=Desulfosarcina sp. TaxID=2027861 RepID=UPI0039708C5C
MKRPTIIQRALLLTVVLALTVLPVSATAKAIGDQLRRTMAEISLLNSQMAQRKTDAAQTRDALAARLEELKTEARKTSQEQGIKLAAKALKNPRIYYDLMLMAEIQAYIDRYTQKISYYRIACDRLSYLYQQADDDLKLVDSLSGMKIDALIAQAEKILDGYLADAQTITIQPHSLKVDAPQNMWEALE